MKKLLWFWDESILVGFVNILEEKEEVFIGIGVNPDLCNKHYGQRMLLITYEISKSYILTSRCIWKFVHGISER